MGLLSSSTSVTRYIVNGKLETSVLEMIYAGLTKNTIKNIDGDPSEKIVGWTSFENPYIPNFEGSSFVIGPYLIFSMRLDVKSIPPKVIKKHYTIEMARQLERSGRKYFSRNEKRSIKDNVKNALCLRIPATPRIYDLIWNVEESWLWFFSNLKAANEELETLFIKSFNLTLIRLFPFTTADLKSDLSDSDRDLLLKLEPINFAE